MMHPSEVAAILAGAAAFIAAAAFFLRAAATQMPRLADAAQRSAEAWRQSAKAWRAREQFVESAVDDLRLRLEKSDIRHAATADELARVKEALVDMTAAFNRVSTDLDRTLSLLNSTREERDELERILRAGGGAEEKALPRPFTPTHVDQTGPFRLAKEDKKP